jgi:O-antigen ligase
MATTATRPLLLPPPRGQVPHPASALQPKERAVSLSTGLKIGAFFLAHVVLAMAMRELRPIATIHAVVSLLAAVIVAVTTRRILNVAFIAAYLSSCEVLWRMNHAAVFWEFGKYSVLLVLAIAVVRIRTVRKNRGLALAYFLLLIPSMVLTFEAFDLDLARQEVSFTLSGPLALTAAVIYFSNIRLTRAQLRATYVAAIGPVLGIAALSLLSTTSIAELEFVNAANSVTSGGFGPNQVSAMLGLGAMLLVLLGLDRVLPWSLRAVAIAIAMALATQAALTFARGGLALGFAGICAGLIFLVRGSVRNRIALVLIAVAIFAVGKQIIEPRLDEFTKGKLGERFGNSKTSGRDLLLSSELVLFEESPILGVGPGVGMSLRLERGEFTAASHTEYSRMLAEHGILGILSLVCLIALGIRAIKGARDPASRGHAAAMVTWVALFLLIYGTRIAAPALVFGLAFVQVGPVIASRRRRVTELARRIA